MPPGWEQAQAEENGRIIRGEIPKSGEEMVALCREMTRRLAADPNPRAKITIGPGFVIKFPIHFGLRGLIEVNAQEPIPQVAELLRVVHKAIRDAIPKINAALPSHVPAFRLYEEGELV